MRSNATHLLGIAAIAALVLAVTLLVLSSPFELSSSFYAERGRVIHDLPHVAIRNADRTKLIKGVYFYETE